MKLLGQLFAVLLAILAIPLFTAAACNLAVSYAISTPQTFQNAFDDQAIFDDLLPITLPFILREATEQAPQDEATIVLSELADTLTTEDWRRITRPLVPSEWLHAQFDLLVEAFIGITKGDLTLLDQPVDFGTVRERLQGEGALAASEALLRAAGPCSRDQLDAIRIALDEGGQIPICVPPPPNSNGGGNADDITLDTMMDVLTAWFNEAATFLPPQGATIAEVFGINRDAARILNLFYLIDQQMLYLLWLCPMALLSLVVMFAIRSIKGFGRWFGVVSFLTGGVILSMIVLLQFFVINSASDLFTADNDVQLFLARVGAGITRTLFTQASGMILLQGGVAVAAGFILLVLATFLPHRDTELMASGTVIITEDGQVISTASQPRPINSFTPPPSKAP